MDTNIKISQQLRGASPLPVPKPLPGAVLLPGTRALPGARPLTVRMPLPCARPLREARPLPCAPPLRQKSGGSVIVETALIFLVFACLLLGAFDFGQFLFVHQALVERARYAARWGAITDPTDSASITNMVLYNSPTGSGTGYFNLTSGNVFVTSPGVGTDNYVLNVRLSGYTYIRVSPYMAGSYVGPQINVSVPLGIFN